MEKIKSNPAYTRKREKKRREKADRPER